MQRGEEEDQIDEASTMLSQDGESPDPSYRDEYHTASPNRCHHRSTPTPMDEDGESQITTANPAYDNIIALCLLRHFKEGPGQW